jgi:hypothetical protein
MDSMSFSPLCEEILLLRLCLLLTVTLHPACPVRFECRMTLSAIDVHVSSYESTYTNTEFSIIHIPPLAYSSALIVRCHARSRHRKSPHIISCQDLWRRVKFCSAPVIRASTSRSPCCCWDMSASSAAHSACSLVVFKEARRWVVLSQ